MNYERIGASAVTALSGLFACMCVVFSVFFLITALLALVAGFHMIAIEFASWALFVQWISMIFAALGAFVAARFLWNILIKAGGRMVNPSISRKNPNQHGGYG